MNWPMERVLLEFGGYRTKMDPSGCSIFAGENYLVRNYDYHPKTYDGIYSLYQPTDGGNAIIGVCQKVTGRSDGMNEKGLAMGYNFMHRRRPGDGFVCNMIGRLILELCENVDEAADLLKEIPHRGSFSYVLFDKNSKIPSIVETSPRRVEVRQGNACTNHFEVMTEENRHILEDSKKRLRAMEAVAPYYLTGKEAYKLLNDTDQGVFSKLYGDWAGTIHTSAYFPAKLEAWYALGGNQEPKKFDFAAWLNGKDFPVERVEGEIDTEIPFVNTEKADWFKS